MKTNMRNEDGTIDVTQFTLQDVVDLIGVFAPMIDVFMGSREEVLRHIAEQDTRFTKHPNEPGTEGYVNYMTSIPLHFELPAITNGPQIQLNLECVEFNEN